MMNEKTLELNKLSELIIAAAFKVSNTLGCGFLEKVYENALMHELHKQGLYVAQQYPLQVHYDGVVVGSYSADLVVNSAIIVELKALRSLDPTHTAQCLNYLKASQLHLALLLNFGRPKLEIRRVML